MSTTESSTDRRLASVCGLYCEACTVFIGSHSDRARLEGIAAKRHVPVDQLECDGCRSDRRPAHCRTCTFISCAATHAVDFCAECAEYPCAALRTFQTAMPHRLELWQDQARIQEAGVEQWLGEIRLHYSCPECRTINSAYDLRCRQCGHEPSCAYVEQHRAAIAGHPLAKP